MLKGQWGFPGFVTSDWGATHSTVPSATAGLDMQMPDASYFGAPLKAAVLARQVPMSRLNDIAVHLWRDNTAFAPQSVRQAGRHAPPRR